MGVKIILNTKAINFDDKKVIVDSEITIPYDYLVNAAGANSLSIYKFFTNAPNYVLMPFRGMYLKSKTTTDKFNTHIYPVPQENEPFLGYILHLRMIVILNWDRRHSLVFREKITRFLPA